MPPEQEKVKSAPPGAKQQEREPVDVLVGARGAIGMGDGRRELGRVEDDRVEAPVRLEHRPQRLVDVGVEGSCARRVEAVQGDVGSARSSAGPDESTPITAPRRRRARRR